MNEVYILGASRTDFKRNLKKEGKTIRHLITEVGKKALDDAKIDPAEIQAGAVGNFNAGQFTKQLQLGAFIPEIDPKLRGIPTMHTEAACASGALSVLLGARKFTSTSTARARRTWLKSPGRITRMRN